MAPSLVPLMHTPLTGPGHSSKNPPDTARFGSNKNPRSRGMASKADRAGFHAIPREAREPREDGGFKKILPHEDCPESSARRAFRPILMRLMSLSRIFPETYRIIRQAPDSASLYAFGKNAFPKFREFPTQSLRDGRRTFGAGSRRRAQRRGEKQVHPPNIADFAMNVNAKIAYRPGASPILTVPAIYTKDEDCPAPS